MLWNLARTYVFQHKNAVNTVWASVSFCLFALVLYVVDPFATKVARFPNASLREPAASRDAPDQPHVTSNSPPSPRPEPFDLDAKLREQENAAFLAKITKLSENASFVAREYREFQNTIQQLAANDDGRKIATDANASADAIALIMHPPIRQDDIQDLLDRVNQFQYDITTPLQSDPSQVVTTVAQRKLAEFRSAIDESQTAVRQAQRAINQIVSLTSHLGLSQRTLGETIEQYRNERAHAFVESVRKAQEAAHQEKIQLAIESEKKQSQDDLDHMRAQAEADRQMKAAEANAKKIATEKAAADTQLLAEFERDWPQVQHYLGMLFVPGETQPTSGRTFGVKLSPQPVSLAGLKAYGAFLPDEAGLEMLLVLFQDTSNDRRIQTPYPNYIGGGLLRGHVDVIKPTMKLLVKYQYLLVEKGLLSP